MMNIKGFHALSIASRLVWSEALKLGHSPDNLNDPVTNLCCHIISTGCNKYTLLRIMNKTPHRVRSSDRGFSLPSLSLDHNVQRPMLQERGYIEL
jgi:hypothetical protein